MTKNHGFLKRLIRLQKILILRKDYAQSGEFGKYYQRYKLFFCEYDITTLMALSLQMEPGIKIDGFKIFL